MTKEELLQRLTDIEWDDFEVKEAQNKMPNNVWETVTYYYSRGTRYPNRASTCHPKSHRNQSQTYGKVTFIHIEVSTKNHRA